MLIALPDMELGAIVLSNSDGGMINVGLIADEMLIQAMAIKTRKNAFTPNMLPVPARVYENKPERYPTGNFATANGIVQISHNKNSLRLKMNGMRFSLTNTGDDWYALRLLLFGFLPIKIASIEALRLAAFSIDGHRILRMEQYGFRVPFGVEYVPINIPSSWADAVGVYRLTPQENLPPFTVLYLTASADTIVLRATARKAGKISLVLSPISDTEATVLGFGRVGGLALELSHQNHMQVLRISGLEFVKS